ncbi:MAG: hypothetical protein ACOC83_08225, partial [Gemmatimonadota bacterium]
MIARLGQATDRKVAIELDIPVRSVTYKRTLLGIPPYCTPVHEGSPFWTAERLALLGQLPDHRLARRWRVSSTTVANRRRKLGIPPKEPRPPKVHWTDPMRSRLGRDPDAAVARRLGIGVRAVREERERLAVPPFRPSRKKVRRSPALRPILQRSTKEITADTDVSAPTVRALRRELAVPPPPRASAWTPAALEKLGTVPDAVLAAELGLKPDTVRKKRYQHGIRKKPSPRRWTPREDELVRAHPPREAARRTRRTLKAVHHRRRILGLPPFPTAAQRRWTEQALRLLG